MYQLPSVRRDKQNNNQHSISVANGEGGGRRHGLPDNRRDSAVAARAVGLLQRRGHRAQPLSDVRAYIVADAEDAHANKLVVKLSLDTVMHSNMESLAHQDLNLENQTKTAYFAVGSRTDLS